MTTITITYRIETAGSVEAMAAKIASDQSTGTFVAVPGETEELKARVAAQVMAIRPLADATHPSLAGTAGRGWPDQARRCSISPFPFRCDRNRSLRP